MYYKSKSVPRKFVNHQQTQLQTPQNALSDLLTVYLTDVKSSSVIENSSLISLSGLFIINCPSFAQNSSWFMYYYGIHRKTSAQ